MDKGRKPQNTRKKRARKQRKAKQEIVLDETSLIGEGAYGKVYDVGELEGIKCVVKTCDLAEDPLEDVEDDLSSDSEEEDFGPSDSCQTRGTSHHSLVREILFPSLYLLSRKEDPDTPIRLCPSFSNRVKDKQLVSILPNRGRNLDEALEERDDPISPCTARIILRQTLEAVAEFQELVPQGFHGDIKPDNVVIAPNQDGELQCTLIDWSLSRSELGSGNEEFSTDWFRTPDRLVHHDEDVREPPRTTDAFGMGLFACWLIMGNKAVSGLYEEARRQNGGLENKRSWMSVIAQLSGLPPPWDSLRELRREESFEEAENDRDFRRSLVSAMLEGQDENVDLLNVISGLLSIDYKTRLSVRQAAAMLRRPTKRHHQVAIDDLFADEGDNPTGREGLEDEDEEEVFLEPTAPVDDGPCRQQMRDMVAKNALPPTKEMQLSQLADGDTIESIVGLATEAHLTPACFCAVLTVAKQIAGLGQFRDDKEAAVRVAALVAVSMFQGPLEQIEADDVGFIDQDIATLCEICKDVNAVERIKWGMAQALSLRTAIVRAITPEQGKRPTKKSIADVIESLPLAYLSAANKQWAESASVAAVNENVVFVDGTPRHNSRLVGRWLSSDW